MDIVIELPTLSILTNGIENWLNSINLTKEDLTKKHYGLTLHILLSLICLGTLIASCSISMKMNKYSFLQKDMQYSFYPK